MENLLFSLNVVAPIFLLMSIGAFLKKIKVFDQDFLLKANKFTFKALLPILLFNNIYKSNIVDEFNVKLITFAICTIFITIGILFILVPKFEKDNRNRGVIIQGLYRSNFVLFGVPLCMNIFGDAGLVTVTTLIAVVIPIYNFLAVIILDIYAEDKNNLKKTVISIMKNPLIIGSILGIIASVIKIKLPAFVESTISDVAKMATPMALMVLGGDIEIKKINNNLKYVTVVTIGKLLVFPALVSFAAYLFGFRGPELGALFCMVAPS
ncbi:MAG: AEC family transporter, partial [Sedimentibacter sp.]